MIKERGLLKKGAEAYIYYVLWFDKEAIKKVRISKKYRDKRLDEVIRRLRTKREAKLLLDVKKIGVPAPVLYDYIPKEYTLIMEYVKGIILKEALIKKMIDLPIVKEIFYEIGKFVARLHESNIIHGDLTTSNMILLDDNSIVLIDFGLGEYNANLEDLGTEIRVLVSSLKSVHYEIFDTIFNEFKIGYIDHFDDGLKVFKKFEEISKRGRYVEERRVKRKFTPRQ